MVVATALCADRVAAAAPVARSPVRQMARQLATRLTVGFRRVVPVARVHEARQENLTAAVAITPSEPVLAFVQRAPLSPFQFRLPPPVV